MREREREREVVSPVWHKVEESHTYSKRIAADERERRERKEG